jgi:hypothetical protein
LTSGDNAQHLDSANDVLAEATTDAQGRFSFTDVPAPKSKFSADARQEPWDLVVTAKGYGLAWKRLTVGARHRPLTVQMAQEASIAGRFVDVEGKPITEVKVDIAGVDSLNQDPSGLHHSSPVNLDLSWSKLLPAAFSDAEGRVTLTGLPAQMRAILQITHIDYQRQIAFVATSDKPASQLTTRTYGPEPGKVNERQIEVHSHVFSLTLQRGHRLRGRIVTADTQRPVAGCQVEFIRKQPQSIFLPIPTDQDGWYLSQAMPAGEYRMIVRPPEKTDYLGVSEEITLGRDGQRETQHSLHLPRGQIVTGTVVDEATGAGIANVQINYRSDAPKALQRGDALLVAPARSDAEGHFRLAVPEGKSKIVLVGPVRGYVADRYLAFPDQQPDARFVREINVTAGQSLSDLRFSLIRGLTLTATILDRESKPMAGVTVIPRGSLGEQTHEFFRPEDARRTDAEGKFTISGLSPDAEGHLYIVDPERKLGTLVPLTLIKDQAVTDLGKIRLQALAAAKGKLVDEDGRPLSGIVVQSRTLAPSGAGRWSFEMPDASGISSADGNFEVPCLLPGMEYQLQFRADGYAYLQSEQFRTEVGFTQNMGTFTLAKADQSLAGIVVDANGKPQPNIRVNICEVGGKRIELPGQDNMLTDGEGRFCFVGLARGKLQIFIRNENAPLNVIDTEAGREDVKLVLP